MLDPAPKPAARTSLTLPARADGDDAKGVQQPLEQWRKSLNAKKPWFGRGDGSLGARLVGAVKTLGWLAPLTLLIWIYAERQQTATRVGVSLPIAAPRDTNTRIYRILEPESRTVTVDLSGPQAGLDRFGDGLGSGTGTGTGKPVEIAVPDQPGHHVHTITVLNPLNDNADLKHYGITARNAVPKTVRIETDDLQEKELRVQPPPGLDLATEPTFSPATVRVVAPSRVFQQAAKDNHLYLTADVADRIAQLTADPDHHPTDPKGQETLPAVRVSWPYGENGKEHVTFSPPTVSATVVFRPHEASYTIPSLGIQPTALVSLLNDYTIVCDERVTNVQVVGPPEAIELLKGGQYRELKARLEINPDDQAQPDVELHRVLKFDLPNGVRVVDPKKYDVTFRLKRRERNG